MQRPPACIASLAECLSLCGKQHPVERHFALNDVLVQVQWRQVVGVIVKAKIRRSANQRPPLTDPLPEHIAGVAFEPPHGRVAAIVGEELRQHLLSCADSQEFSVSA